MEIGHGRKRETESSGERESGRGREGEREVPHDVQEAEKREGMQSISPASSNQAQLLKAHFSVNSIYEISTSRHIHLQTTPPSGDQPA